MESTDRKNLMISEFFHRHGCYPEFWTRAPGRVDLMGSHTDYNMGHVMTISIDKDTWIAASPRLDDSICVSSLNFDGVSEFKLEQIEKDEETPWADYIRGMAKEFLEGGIYAKRV